MNLSKYLKYLGALVLLLLVFGSGWWWRDIGAQQEVNKILSSHEIQLQEIEVVKTKQISSLASALADGENDQAVLLDQIASLKSKPAEIRYITKIETILVGEPTLVTTELPDSHMFRTSIGLPVAQFVIQAGPKYQFNTADLHLEANLVIAERDSALSLRISSDLEPGTQYEIPVDKLNVTSIRNTRFFEPHVLLGASFSPTTTRLGFTGAVSLLHGKRKPIDGIVMRAIWDPEGILFGIDPVLYNVGDPLPVLTNLWVGAGPTINTSGKWGASISIGAKL